jgi:hypothetical protein
MSAATEAQALAERLDGTRPNNTGTQCTPRTERVRGEQVERFLREVIRSVLPVLVLALAGCAYSGPPVTWVETAPQPLRPDVYAKMFFVDRQWDVGDCTLRPGSHVTLSRAGSANVGLGLSTRSGRAARWRYGITFLAADGTTLAHYPYPDGRVFLLHVPAGARDFGGGTGFPITADVYERVTRVLIHARC